MKYSILVRYVVNDREIAWENKAENIYEKGKDFQFEWTGPRGERLLKLFRLVLEEMRKIKNCQSLKITKIQYEKQIKVMSEYEYEKEI